MLRIFIYLAVLLLPLSANALTVDEAVKLALDSNNVIKNKMSIVEARNIEAKNSFLLFMPSIGFSYNYGYNWDNLTPSDKDSSDYESSSAVASANLNIFNGLYDINAIKAARIGRDMAETDVTLSQYDIKLKAQNDFIAVLQAQSNLNVANENLELLKLQKRDAQLSADNGLIAKNDLLQVDTYLASAELQRINAESNLTIARQALENTINQPLSKDEILVEPVMNNVVIENIDTLRDLMLENNSQIKYLEQSYDATKKNQNMAMKSVYPTVDFKTSYTAYGKDINAWSGSRNQQSPDSNITVGVTASWNILNAFSSFFQSRAIKKEAVALGYTIADTKQKMTLQLKSAVETYYTSLATLKQSEISVTSAEENYRVIKNQYDQSAATMTDLLNASVLLNEAKFAKSNAIYGVISSVYNIERLIESSLPIKE